MLARMRLNITLSDKNVNGSRKEKSKKGHCIFWQWKAYSGYYFSTGELIGTKLLSFETRTVLSTMLGDCMLGGQNILDGPIFPLIYFQFSSKTFLMNVQIKSKGSYGTPEKNWLGIT